ncbi:MAG: YqgE/AlgH family protein, partial [Candidatus Methylomirabilales bacterium]
TQPKPTETFRAYAGYAGWAPGQLEFEMALGSWATLQADPASIFDKDPISLWSDMLKALSAPRVIHSRRAHGAWTSQILPAETGVGPS